MRSRNMPIRGFSAAIFPSCTHPVGLQPAGSQTVDSWEGRPEPRQLPGASLRPDEFLLIIQVIYAKEKENTKNNKNRNGFNWDRNLKREVSYLQNANKAK